MKFRGLIHLDDNYKDYIFRLEMIAAGLEDPLFSKPEFLAFRWVVKNLEVKFTRKFNYYLIDCLIPLEVFRILYSDEWKEEIIPGGKYGLQGLLPNTIFFDSDGKRIISQADFDKIGNLLGLHNEALKQLHPAPPSVVDFSQIGEGYVKNCEILSIEAMQHFVSVLKEKP